MNCPIQPMTRTYKSYAHLSLDFSVWTSRVRQSLMSDPPLFVQHQHSPTSYCRSSLRTASQISIRTRLRLEHFDPSPRFLRVGIYRVHCRKELLRRCPYLRTVHGVWGGGRLYAVQERERDGLTHSYAPCMVCGERCCSKSAREYEKLTTHTTLCMV
jgi:hypothetical protein